MVNSSEARSTPSPHLEFDKLLEIEISFLPDLHSPSLIQSIHSIHLQFTNIPLVQISLSRQIKSNLIILKQRKHAILLDISY
ncbi:hypothetical protein BLNAU_14393 [Blattamonas nauphoetae]|uniref:Uncharacterized protein n=1 Tax=Blattamonas nauphoetae TaxID=2049346 RepID=A0ABQ9XE30_9EUKA|nr:hypothetical protein BLNAU_14393 [Blattamonas nauphoetae]